jgi:hypothetical protein
MATTTLTASADAIGVTTPLKIAAGAGVHLPVGTWNGYNYRAGIRFTKPSWSSWSLITKAELHIYVSDHAHVGVKNSTITVRKTGSVPWTQAEGSSTCEALGATNTTQREHLVAISTMEKTFSSGTTANAKKVIDVTDMVRWFMAQNQNPVFCLDGDSSNYSEFWSRSKSSTYAPKLVITYDVGTGTGGGTTGGGDTPVTYPPAAPPSGSGDPPTGSTVTSQTPTLTWQPNSVLPVTQTEVQVLSADSSTVVWQGVLPGDGTSIVVGTELPRGHQYWWQVRQTNTDGTGPWSTPQVFMVADNPKPGDVTKVLEFVAGSPRVRVSWTVPAGFNIARYRVTWDGFDSGWITGSANTYRSDTFSVIGVGQISNLQVHVEDTNGLQGRSDMTFFQPKYALTTHRKDLGEVPMGWGQASIDPPQQAAGQVWVEFGSSSSANQAPDSGWFTTLGATPRAQFLFYRVWMLPGPNGESPVVRLITISVERKSLGVDDWVLSADASISLAEYVYGTRSIEHDNNGNWIVTDSAVPIRLLAGRSYILTGLMKSRGDSTATIMMMDETKSVALAQTESLHETRDWFTPDAQNTYRYASQVFVPQNDMDVYVRLATFGPAGMAAWFDAIKLEESTVATPWSPAQIGAAVLDAGGVQIDGTKGGVFRYRGRDGNIRSMVEGGVSGLVFGGDTEITSPSDGQIAIDGTLVSLVGHTHEGGGSTAPHNHDGVYQPVGSYAGATHDHSGVYQPLGSYAPNPHYHGEYAGASHNHDGVYQPVGAGGGGGGWYLVRTNQTAPLNNFQANTGDNVIELTDLPANDPKVKAASCWLMVRSTVTNANVSFTVKDYSGGTAGLTYTSGAVSRGGVAGPFPVLVGGINNRQIRWTASDGSAGHTVWLYIHGYWREP